MSERRRESRWAAEWPSRVWTDDAVLVGATVDVSDFGLCFVSAPTAALKIGTCYRIEVVGSSGEAIATVAEVRHISARGVGFRTQNRVTSQGVVFAR
jgi:hypothetical protein